MRRNGNYLMLECSRIFDPKTQNHENECKMDAQSAKMTTYLTIKLCRRLNEKYTAPSKYLPNGKCRKLLYSKKRRSL